MSSRVTRFQLRAALIAGRLIDSCGNDERELDSWFNQVATDGIFDSIALRAARELLEKHGLLEVSDGRIRPTQALSAVSGLADIEAMAALRLVIEGAAAKGTDGVDTLPAAGSVDYAAIGAAGEEYVLDHCRRELIAFDRADLAAASQRVSLISDALGYDIISPTTNAETRRLEVKTQKWLHANMFRFFLTRNEYEVGRRLDSWALTCCVLEPEPAVLGWCRVAALHPYLPQDANGRWTEALVVLPLNSLTPGVPSSHGKT